MTDDPDRLVMVLMAQTCIMDVSDERLSGFYRTLTPAQLGGLRDAMHAFARDHGARPIVSIMAARVALLDAELERHGH